MIEVALPFSKYFVCSICGDDSTDPDRLLDHESIPTIGIPSVNLYDEIEISELVKEYDGTPHLTIRRETFSVTSLFYAKPNHRIIMSKRLQPQTHELCIELSQAQKAGPLATWERRPYNKELEKAGWIISWMEMTYAEFLLWQRGDRAELEQAGLVKPPEVKKPRLSNKILNVFR